MNYMRAIVPILVTLGLLVCAILLVTQHDIQNALLFAALVVPNVQQAHAAGSTDLIASTLLSTDHVPPAAARGFVQLRALLSLVAVTCIAFALVACGWWANGGEAKVADAGDCIAQHALAGDNDEQIGVACSLPVAKIIESLASTTDAKLAATPAARESRAARASMAAVDGGS